MRNNRRGFVFGGAAGLTALLAPNVAQACFCRRCRRAAAQPAICVAEPTIYAAQPTTYVVRSTSHMLSSWHCPTWGGITLPGGTLSPNVSYPFITYGTGLYAAYVAGVTFTPVITDANNNSTVSWGSYWHGPVVPGTSGNPDQLTINAAYTVTGSSLNHTGNLTITVTITSPPNTCNQGLWANQLVTYS